MFERVKIKNIKNILLYLLGNGAATKPKLVRATALSNSTVSDTVNAMRQLGFLLTDGEHDSAGGRRSVIYRLNSGFGCFLGVTLDGDGALLCRTDACGKLLGHVYTTWHGSASVLEQIYGLLETACADATRGKVLGVGIGVPGLVDHPAQKVLYCAPLGWENVPLTALIRERLDLCCLTDHTANGQVALHKVFGGARDTDDFAVICEAFGTKLALCLDGHTCRGMNNLCGVAENFTALCSAVGVAAPLLDLNRLLCGWRTNAGKEQLVILASQSGMPSVRLYEAGDADLALGMALLGEIRWFETVYYLM
jgi:hypothetical protein